MFLIEVLPEGQLMPVAAQRHSSIICAATTTTSVGRRHFLHSDKACGGGKLIYGEGGSPSQPNRLRPPVRANRQRGQDIQCHKLEAFLEAPLWKALPCPVAAGRGGAM